MKDRTVLILVIAGIAILLWRMNQSHTEQTQDTTIDVAGSPVHNSYLAAGIRPALPYGGFTPPPGPQARVLGFPVPIPLRLPRTDFFGFTLN